MKRINNKKFDNGRNLLNELFPNSECLFEHGNNNTGENVYKLSINNSSRYCIKKQSWRNDESNLGDWSEIYILHQGVAKSSIPEYCQHIAPSTLYCETGTNGLCT